MGGVKRFARVRRSRKIPSLLLLVALVSSVALFGLAGPATAAPDAKEYQVFIGPAFISPTPAVDKDVLVGELAGVDGRPTVEIRLTFENLISNTGTQRLGAARAVFDTAFNVVSADTPFASGGQTWVASVTQSSTGDIVLIQANNAGAAVDQRILPSQTVSVDVTLETPAATVPETSYEVDTSADQQASGDFSGGNVFTLIGDGVTITVGSGRVAHCQENQTLCSTGQDPDDQGGSGAVECYFCKVDTTLTVDFLEDFCDANDCIAVWDANSTPEGTDTTIFYLVIQIPDDFRGSPEIIYSIDGVTFLTAKSCSNRVPAPCIDTNLTDKQAGIYYLKLDDDPIGGYR